jgi:hypothetical protein
MRSTTRNHRTTLTNLAVASLVTMLAAGCGQGPADRRAAEQKESTAEVAAGAQAYAGDPWERRARTHYWAKQDIHDGWEHRVLAEHEQQTKALDDPTSCN